MFFFMKRENDKIPYQGRTLISSVYGRACSLVFYKESPMMEKRHRAILHNVILEWVHREW